MTLLTVLCIAEGLVAKRQSEEMAAATVQIAVLIGASVGLENVLLQRQPDCDKKTEK